MAGEGTPRNQEEARREQAIDELFTLYDLDGNGSISMSELIQVVQAAERTKKGKDTAKWIAKIKAKCEQARRSVMAQERIPPGGLMRRGSQYQLLSGGSVMFEPHGEPSLDPDAFSGFLQGVTAKYDATEFDEFISDSRKSVEEAIESTRGTKLKKQLWELFMLVDSNHNGLIEMNELEVLLNAESRADKKHIAKWKNYLKNKNWQGALDRQNTSNLSPDAPTDALDELQMSLRDFHEFVHEYVDHDEARIPQLLAAVRAAIQNQQVDYILKYRVHDVINDIMGDLLRERPTDILSGIEASVKRLRRIKKVYSSPIAA